MKAVYLIVFMCFVLCFAYAAGMHELAHFSTAVPAPQ